MLVSDSRRERSGSKARHRNVMLTVGISSVECACLIWVVVENQFRMVENFCLRMMPLIFSSSTSPL